MDTTPSVGCLVRCRSIIFIISIFSGFSITGL
jgi:hypothetical protein